MKKFFVNYYFLWERLLLLFFVFVIFCENALAAQNIKIEIPNTIYVSGKTFTLGKAAKISGGTKNTRQILSSLKLFSDGNVLTRDEVLRAIQESNASDARIELYMPSSVQIEKPDYEGNFTESKNIVSNRSVSSLIPVIKSLSAWNGDVEISTGSEVPDGKLIDPASIIPGTPATTLRFRDDSGNIKSLGVRLTWYQNVLIASKNIKKGDVLRPQNFFTRKMKISRPGIYASNTNEISGFKANKIIKQGEPVMFKDLTSSSLIKKGRNLKVIARYGGAKAVTDGVLLEDAKPGDFARVRRSDNRKIIFRAKILDENNAEVDVN